MKMSPTPDEQTNSRRSIPVSFVFHHLAERTKASAGRKPASSNEEGHVDFEQYQRMVGDHPKKFTPEQVGYRAADGAERCGACAHFFTNTVMDRRVCEIMRTNEENPENIKADWVCDFMTPNNEDFPLLKGVKNSVTARSKGNSKREETI